jgi:hypothetical protein
VRRVVVASVLEAVRHRIVRHVDDDEIGIDRLDVEHLAVERQLDAALSAERVVVGTVKYAVLDVDPLFLIDDERVAGFLAFVRPSAGPALAVVARSFGELEVHRDDRVLDDLVVAAGQVEGGLVHVVGVQLEGLAAQRGHLRVVGRPDGDRAHRQVVDVRVGVAEDVAVLVHDLRGHVGVRVPRVEGHRAQSAGVLGRVGDVGVRHRAAVGPDNGILVAARPGAGTGDEQHGRESGQKHTHHGLLLAANAACGFRSVGATKNLLPPAKAGLHIRL